MTSSVSNSGSGSAGSAGVAAAAVNRYDKQPFINAALPHQIPIEVIALISGYANEILGGLYGEEAWRQWRNVEILDKVPPAPKGGLCKAPPAPQGLSKDAVPPAPQGEVSKKDEVPPVPQDLSKKAAAQPVWENDSSRADRILLYVPQRIRFNGQEQNLTLTALKTISGGFSYFDPKIEEQFGKETAQGWVFLDKAVIHESRGKDTKTQKKMVEARGCSMMHPIEAILLNKMVFEFTGAKLFGLEPLTYTRCNRQIDGRSPVVVGGFSSFGLYVISRNLDADHDAAACALRP